MSKTGAWRLTGGIFFTLLLRALKQRSGKREFFTDDSDGLSEPEVLYGLSKVIRPDLQIPSKNRKGTIKTDTSNHKACKKNGGSYFPFEDPSAIEAFDVRVRNMYSSVVNDMATFVSSFVDIKSSDGDDVSLVKALLAVINTDDSIHDVQEFYAFPNGATVSKKKLLHSPQICLPSFLLGTWHYAVCRSEKNIFGRETYNEWYPPDNHKIRSCTIKPEEYFDGNVDILYDLDNVEEVLNADDVLDAISENEQDSAESNEAAKKQSPVGQQNIFQQFGNGNNQYAYAHIVNIGR